MKKRGNWLEVTLRSAGGSFEITGSVFGLDPDSRLLSGTVLEGWCGTSYNRSGNGYGFDSTIWVDYINPALLEAFDLQPTSFVGSLGGGGGEVYSEAAPHASAYLSITPTPEPATLTTMTLGALLLAFRRRRAGLTRRA